MRIRKLRTLWFLALLVSSGAALADDTRYLIRVDGLACPLCAFSIERQFKNTEGVIPDSIQVDLAEGRVQVDVRAGVTLSDEMLDELFRDAGFTYRGKVTEPVTPDEDA